MDFLKSIFLDGSKASFARASAFIVIVFGLLMVGGALGMEYVTPSNTLTVTNVVMNPEGEIISYEKSAPVSKPDWENYTNFLQWGITPLAVLLYGGGKLSGAAKDWVRNGNGNGKD